MRLVESVASTASPRAPPTCMVVLTRPEARPASSGFTPVIARVMIDGNESPAPIPTSTIAGSTSDQ